MVKHIVFFELKDNSKENKKRLKEKLLSMDGKIDVLQKIEVGINFCKEQRAYDVALLTDFKSEKDLESYIINPYHLDIVAYVKTVITSSKVIDFKY